MSKRRVAFVVDRLGFQEMLSIPILSALARGRGHTTALFEFRRPARACARIASFAPDIIAYSVCSSEAERYLEINRFLRSRLRFFSLFGGPHPTSGVEQPLDNVAPDVPGGAGDQNRAFTHRGGRPGPAHARADVCIVHAS